MAYFSMTTVNALVDVVFFEDWSLHFAGSVLWRLCATICYLMSHGKIDHRTNVFLRIVFVFPFLVEAYYWVGKMPFTWESDLWSVQSDLVVSLWVLSYGFDTDGVNILSETTHEMYSSFYTAAGFWKINSHFLNPTTSCATVFLCQHIAQNLSTWLSWESQVSLVQKLAPFAPWGTVIIELSMGLIFGFGRFAPSHHRQWTRRGMLLILYFHLAVCLTPPPNNISLFALQCASRLVLMTDPDALAVVTAQLWLHIMPMATVMAIGVSYGIQNAFTPLNWSFLAYAPILMFLHWVLVVEESTSTDKNITSTVKGTVQRDRPIWTRVATTMAVFYSFGTIILGVMEEASCNMFANLKVHGGSSNHLLVPTGLLFDWFRESGDAHPYGGGEIRIEATDSKWLQLIYPNDLSYILEPETAPDRLEAAVGAMRPNFFNAGANRVLGLREREWIPAPPHGRFLKYSVPSIEWKRLLREAIEKDKTFHVAYVHLPGNQGDEVWRATAWERRIVLHVHDQQIVQCTVELANSTDLLECQDSHLPYHLNDLPWWLQKIGLYHGYPILYTADGNVRPSIQCFGP